MILRRLVSCFALALLVTASAADPTPRRPNILWLAGENLAHDLGCYGEKNVRTPHLDRLAAEGVRYTNVIATNPTCAPSRSAFFTGMYQTTTDTHPMRSHRTDAYRLPDGVRLRPTVSATPATSPPTSKPSTEKKSAPANSI